MARSQLQIINTALVMIGARPIANPGEDSTAAIVMRAIYETTLDATLRVHPWNFAIARAQLPQLVERPVSGYSYQYQRPADWLRTLDTDAEDFRNEGDRILTNSGTLSLRYIRRVTDPNLYDPLFVNCFARHLASKAAFPITKSTSLADSLFSLYVQELAQATRTDALEEPAEEMPESELIAARYR